MSPACSVPGTNDTMNDNHDITGIASLLRAAADGELGAEDRARLDAYLAEHPEYASCVAFERELKSACARAMGDARCPDSVRARIEAMRGQDAADVNEGVVLGGATRDRSFWQRSGLMGAMAAALVLAGGALIWNSSSLITGGSGVSAPVTTQVSYAERVGEFVAREHARCTLEQAAQGKFVVDSIDDAVARYSGAFGAEIVAPVCEKNVTFYGGGDCHLPSTATSAHLRFDAQVSEGNVAHMSLFVAPDPGLLELEESVTYVVDSASCAERGAALFVWTKGGVMYVLVSEAAPGTTECAEIRAMMRAPSETKKL